MIKIEKLIVAPCTCGINEDTLHIQVHKKLEDHPNIRLTLVTGGKRVFMLKNRHITGCSEVNNVVIVDMFSNEGVEPGTLQVKIDGSRATAAYTDDQGVTRDIKKSTPL